MSIKNSNPRGGDSAEAKTTFDISKPANFDVFNRNLVSDLGVSCNGLVMSALNYDRIDQQLEKCIFEPSYTMVAPGAKYRNVTYPDGLNYEQFRAIFALNQDDRSRENKREFEKKRDKYLCDVTTTIMQVEIRFSQNTKSFFNANTIYQDAKEANDLIKLIREVRKLGPRGTKSAASAMVQWQNYVTNPKGSEYMLAGENSCDSDFNLFQERWKGLRKTIESFGANAFTESDYIQGIMRALPLDDNLLSPLRSVNLATSQYTNLDAALKGLHDAILSDNRDIANCTEKKASKRKADTVAFEEESETKHGEGVSIMQALSDMKEQISHQRNSSCRVFDSTGKCDFQKRFKSPCRFAHLGAFDFIDNVIVFNKEKEDKKKSQPDNNQRRSKRGKGKE